MLKDAVRRELRRTTREVHAGQRHIATAAAARLAEHSPRVALTERGLQIPKLAARGLRNREIGAAPKIAEGTGRIHLKHIYSKLEVLDRTEAVASAAHRGFIELGLHENRRECSSPMA